MRSCPDFSHFLFLCVDFSIFSRPNPTPNHRTTEPNHATPNPTPDTTPNTPTHDPSPHPKAGRGDRQRRGTNLPARGRGRGLTPNREGRRWRGERPTGGGWSVNRRQRGEGANHHRRRAEAWEGASQRWEQTLPPKRRRRGRSSLLLSGGAPFLLLLGWGCFFPVPLWVVPIISSSLLGGAVLPFFLQNIEKKN